MLTFNAFTIASTDTSSFASEDVFPAFRHSGFLQAVWFLCLGLGLKKPPQCKLFGKECTPEHPKGAPMVSSEGACAAYFRYGKT